MMTKHVAKFSGVPRPVAFRPDLLPTQQQIYDRLKACATVAPVTALAGTRRGDGGEVVVTQGVVELTAAGGRARRLTVGQAARYDDAGRSIAVNAPPTPVAWTHGRLQFVATPVSDLLGDLARYGAGTPVILDASVGARRVTGSIDVNDPAVARDTVLARVGAQARRIGPWVFVTRR